MSFRTRALTELRAKRELIAKKRAWVGLDGFVDTIVAPVGQRSGPGEAFTTIATIPEFGQRVLGAAGKSTNIELYPRMEKFGGNGPIMAAALLAAGTQTTLVGALGHATVLPVFDLFSSRAKVFSLADPARTTAIEFADGKLMLGQTRTLDEITYARMLAVMGETALRASLDSADLVALTNWTMITGMSEIFQRLTQEILPTLSSRERIYFFDLADPEKRSVRDLREALHQISSFERYGRVTLGLNLKEAQQVSSALELRASSGESEAVLLEMAEGIRRDLRVATVVIHPRQSAACASSTGTAWVPGPYCENPIITTGAGDHFNAGFSTGQLLGLSLEACLAVGVSTSGMYVRTGTSPSLSDLETFLATWE